MTRKQMKSQAKSLMKNSTPRPVYVTVIYVVILMAFAILSFKLISQPMNNFMDSQFGDLFVFYPDGTVEISPDFEDRLYNLDYDAVIDAYREQAPSTLARLLNLALAAVQVVIGAGFIIFTLRTIDGQGASYWNLFDGFGMFFRIIWLYILEGIFTFLWTLLFFFPGIIAFYRYRMAIYLLLEHPEMSAMDCIRESKRLMKGHKWELFVFDLSFIGWALLIFFVNGFGSGLGLTLFGVVGLGYIGYVFFLPYTQLSYSIYYRQLSAVPNAEEAWTPEL